DGHLTRRPPASCGGESKLTADPMCNQLKRSDSAGKQAGQTGKGADAPGDGQPRPPAPYLPSCRPFFRGRPLGSGGGSSVGCSSASTSRIKSTIVVPSARASWWTT